MPERETMMFNLGNGQINLNGTMLDVGNIEFTQDTVDITGRNDEVVARLNTGGTFTATIDNAVYDAFQNALERVEYVVNEAPNPTEQLQELIDRVATQTQAPRDDWFYATTTGYHPAFIRFDEATGEDQASWYRYNPSYVHWNYDISSVKDAILEEELSAKKNCNLDKFLGEFAPKEAV